MTQPPQLFDRTAVIHRRRRQTHDAMFLQEVAFAEIQERLEQVNKTFTKPAIITGFPEFWRGLFPQAALAADDDAIDLAHAPHDLIVHAMALHMSNDPVGQLIQSVRALRPDGLFLAVSYGGQTLNELRSSLGQAEVDVMGGLSPRVSPMVEIRDFGALLQRAGFALPVADTLTQTVSYKDLRSLMYDLRHMGEANPLVGRQKSFTRSAIFKRAEAIYRDNFADDHGRLIATFDLVFLSGWSPHESQQQPLKPGSAKTSLLDALNTLKEGVKD